MSAGSAAFDPSRPTPDPEVHALRDERQAELRAVLADKGPEAARCAAVAHARADHAKHRQYDGRFDSMDLAVAKRGLSTKGGRTMEPGDLLLVEDAPPPLRLAQRPPADGRPLALERWLRGARRPRPRRDHHARGGSMSAARTAPYEIRLLLEDGSEKRIRRSLRIDEDRWPQAHQIAAGLSYPCSVQALRRLEA